MKGVLLKFIYFTIIRPSFIDYQGLYIYALRCYEVNLLENLKKYIFLCSKFLNGYFFLKTQLPCFLSSFYFFPLEMPT